MKKVILFIDSLGAGGAQRQLVGLAILLKENNIDVTVCTYFDLDFYKCYLDNFNIPNFVIGKSHNYIKRIINVRSFILSNNPDWVIAYQETPSLIACVVRLFGGKFKLLVSERNTTQKIKFADRVRFLLYQFADSIITNSFSQARFVKSFKPYLKNKVSTIVNFVDTEYFRPPLFKTENSILRIIVAATVSDSKNTIPFIYAISEVSKKGFKNFIVEWYGEVDTNLDRCLECKKLIDQLELGDYFVIKRKTKDILSVYQKADIFCLPSLFEGTPNALAEAMSCGLPVIVSDVCDNNLYVKSNINGFLFNPLCIQSMTQVFIEAISTDYSRLQEYGRNSRKIALESFSKSSFIDSYLNIINL